MNVAFDANIAFKKYEWMNDWLKQVSNLHFQQNWKKK